MSDFLIDVFAEAEEVETEDSGTDITEQSGAEETAQADTQQSADTTPSEDEKTGAEGERGSENTIDDNKQDLSELTVKFNKEMKKLSHDDAVRYAQLGMLLEQDGGEDSIRWLRQAAKSAGYDNVADYRVAVQKEMDKANAARMAEEKDIPLDVAEEMLDQKRQLERYKQENEESKSAEQEQKKLAEEANEFKRLFPGVDLGNLSNDVYIAKLRKPEVPISYHYSFYKMKQLETERAVNVKQRENEASAQGNLRSEGTSEGTEEDNIINSIFNKS